MAEDQYLIKKYVGKILDNGAEVTIVSGWNNFEQPFGALKIDTGKYQIISPGDEFILGNTYLSLQIVGSSSGATFIGFVDFQSIGVIEFHTLRSSTEALEDIEEVQFEITIYPTLP